MNNSDTKLLDIKALAYKIGGKKLTVKSLAKAILLFDKSRKIVAGILDTDEMFLLKLPEVSYDVPPDIDMIPWPKTIVKRIRDSKNLDMLLSSDQNDSFESVWNDENAESTTNIDSVDLVLGVDDIHQLIEAVTEEVDRSFWFKKKVYENINDLSIKLRSIFGNLMKAYPYHENNLRSLKKVLFHSFAEHFMNDIEYPSNPIIIIASKTSNIEIILREFAKQLECKFEIINGQSSEDTFVISDTEEYPLTIRVFRFRDNDFKLSNSMQEVFDYYETGILAKNESSSTSHLTLLGSIDDIETKATRSFEDKALFVLNNHINIFILKTDASIISGYTSSHHDVLDRILERYEISYKSDYSSEHWNDLKFIERLIDIVHSESFMIFGDGCPNKKYAILNKYTDSLARKAKIQKLCYSKEDIAKLSLLAVLKTGGFDLRSSKGVIRQVFFEIEELSRYDDQSNKKELVFHSACKEIDGLFAKILQMNKPDRIIDYIKEKFFNLNIKIDFRIEYDSNSAKIFVKDIKAYSKLKEGSILVQRPKIRFDDVIGYQEIKNRFKMIIEFFKKKDEYQAMDIKISNRILLFGPPGTGKTMLAQAFAGEIGYPFFAISAAEVTSQKYAGEGGLLLRTIFEKAKKSSPSVLFLDELDAFSSRDQFKGEGGSVAHDARSIINSLLVLLDGFEDNSEVIVIGATNRPEDLDSALTRSKRFGLKFEMLALTAPEREQLIRKHLRPIECEADYDQIVGYIKSRTYGDFSPAKIVDIVEEIKFHSIVEKQKLVNLDDIALIIDKYVYGQKIKQLDPEFKKITAFHEAGHAVVYRYLFPDSIIHRVSVGYRKDSLGITSFDFGEEDKGFTLKNSELIKYLCVFLAGMQAEKIKFNHWDVGSEDDMLRSTKIATLLSPNLDLGSGLKPAIEYSFAMLGFSDQSITDSIKSITVKLIESCTDKTHEILHKCWEYVESLANELYKKEDLSWNEIEPLLIGLPVNEEPLIRTIQGMEINY